MSGERHEIRPMWSALYDTYQCGVCRIWIWQHSGTGEWRHAGWSEGDDDADA